MYGISRVLERPDPYVQAELLKGSNLEIFYEARENLLELLKPEVRLLTDV